MELELEPGFEAPEPHIHDQHVEAFYVLDGEAEFVLGAETLLAGAGSFVAAPPGVVHTFSSGAREQPAAQRSRAELRLPGVASREQLAPIAGRCSAPETEREPAERGSRRAYGEA